MHGSGVAARSPGRCDQRSRLYLFWRLIRFDPFLRGSSHSWPGKDEGICKWRDAAWLASRFADFTSYQDRNVAWQTSHPSPGHELAETLPTRWLLSHGG